MKNNKLSPIVIFGLIFFGLITIGGILLAISENPTGFKTLLVAPPLYHLVAIFAVLYYVGKHTNESTPVKYSLAASLIIVVNAIIASVFFVIYREELNDIEINTVVLAYNIILIIISSVFAYKLIKKSNNRRMWLNIQMFVGLAGLLFLLGSENVYLFLLATILGVIFWRYMYTKLQS